MAGLHETTGEIFVCLKRYIANVYTNCFVVGCAESNGHGI